MPLAPQITITPITVTSSNMTVTSVIAGGTPATTEQVTDVEATATVALATANDAYADALTALTTANTAQSTANGKNKVTYSSTTPGSTANTAGDIWFQYSGAIVIAQYEGLGGTSWRSVELGSAVIANLDAGKITSGIINAGIVTITNTGSTTGGNRLQLDANGLKLFDSSGTGTVDLNSVTGAATFTGSIIGTSTITIGSGTNVFKADSNGIYLGSASFSSAPFRVTQAGALTATNATITGAITGASTITIGSGSSIFKADSNGIYLGNSTFASAPFRVTPAGDLTASSATITGVVNSGSKIGGTSGGFDVAADRISYGTDVVFYASGSGLYALDTTRTIQANIFTATSSGNAIVAQNGNIYAAAGNISAAGSISGGNITSDTNRFYMASPPSIGSANGTMMRWHTTNHYMGIDSSSRRFKENIVDAGDIEWGNVLSQLRPVTFTRKDDETNTVNLGYIAEEFAEIPEMRFVVVNDENGAPFSISYDYLSVYAIEAIKEANTKIASLESKVSDLETRLTALETKTA